MKSYVSTIAIFATLSSVYAAPQFAEFETAIYESGVDYFATGPYAITNSELKSWMNVYTHLDNLVQQDLTTLDAREYTSLVQNLPITEYVEWIQEVFPSTYINELLNAYATAIPGAESGNASPTDLLDALEEAEGTALVGTGVTSAIATATGLTEDETASLRASITAPPTFTTSTRSATDSAASDSSTEEEEEEESSTTQAVSSDESSATSTSTDASASSSDKESSETSATVNGANAMKNGLSAFLGLSALFVILF